MNTRRDMTLKEFIDILDFKKMLHKNCTGERIEITVTSKVESHRPVLYLDVKNFTKDKRCIRGMVLDEFIKYEEPRICLYEILNNIISETTDFEREMEAC